LWGERRWRSVGDWVAVAEMEERERESEATTVKSLKEGEVTERGERKAERGG
jgi:hypothetical protein